MQILPLPEPPGPATPLSFPLTLADGRTIASVYDATTFFSDVTDERRSAGYWRIAARMLDLAKKEPAYMKAATMSLQTALILDGLAESMSPPERTERG